MNDSVWTAVCLSLARWCGTLNWQTRSGGFRRDCSGEEEVRARGIMEAESTHGNSVRSWASTIEPVSSESSRAGGVTGGVPRLGICGGRVWYEASCTLPHGF